MSGRIEHQEKTILGYLDADGRFQEVGGSGTAAHFLPIMNIGIAKEIAVLNGGEFKSVTVVPGAAYQILSESNDIQVYGSSTAHVRYIDTATGKIAYQANGISTDWDIGSGDFSLDFWVQDTLSGSSSMVFAVGRNGFDQIKIAMNVDASTRILEMTMDIDDTSAALIYSLAIGTNIGTFVPETGVPFHVVCTFDRPGAAANTAKIYVNGTLLRTETTWGTASPDGLLNAGTNTVGDSKCTLGGNTAGTPAQPFNAKILDIRMYTSELSLTEISTINKYGPGHYPTSDILSTQPAIGYSTSDSPNWVDLNEPEFCSGATSYNGTRVVRQTLNSYVTWTSSTLEDDISTVTGNDVASYEVSTPILANTPTTISIPSGVTELLLYSLPEATTNVQVIQI